MKYITGYKFYLLSIIMLIPFSQLFAQKVFVTGKGKMPNEWIDSSTGHLIKRLINRPGNNRSFYFHNNPFVDGKMIFYGSDFLDKNSLSSADGYVFHFKGNPYNNQLYSYNLSSGKTTQLTHKENSMSGEIVSRVNHEAYFQIKDSVFGVNVNTAKTRLIFVFPADFKGNITTVNADGTLLAGAYSTPIEKVIAKKYPQKHDYFNRIFESKQPRTLFTINIISKKLNKIFTDSAWLNHVQFSPIDPHLLMFCHEGPWEKVDRIWTMDVVKKNKPRLIHKRSMNMEIAGHEWFSPDGKYIWYDLQLPRGKNFYVGGTELATGKEIKYHLLRNEWSVHYTTSWDESVFAGDGGGPNSVAKSPNGQWIYLFNPEGDHFRSEKLVDMKYDDYKLEPNLHFSPDNKWLIFRANFEGHTDIYEVRIKKSLEN
ncbi:oligogalacturonate lyase family protein [Arachidicoccus soli]|nr:oligogalacturonate lyase family protein [Arachidicoccus soli]